MIWRPAQGRRAVYEALRVGRPLVEGGPALGWMARPNGSEQAQVDLYGTTCTEVSQTLGVDAANESGRSFRSGNFTCLSTAEGPVHPGPPRGTARTTPTMLRHGLAGCLQLGPPLRPVRPEQVDGLWAAARNPYLFGVGARTTIGMTRGSPAKFTELRIALGCRGEQPFALVASRLLGDHFDRLATYLDRCARVRL